MASFAEIARLCPYPVVNLHNVDVPRDGFLLETPDICRHNFGKEHRCREHYEKLMDMPSMIGKPVQCPCGFSSFVVATNTQHLAITGVVPYPRLGGPMERGVAKKHPSHKITVASLENVATNLQDLEQKIGLLEQSAVNNHSMALHEIRKLNRTVKQNAERLCRKENPSQPEMASNSLVNIWKSSELMSSQFEIIEMLANESLADLPLKSKIEVYRIFDKCVRIYDAVGGQSRITLHAPPGFFVRIEACDKTFPIIPTVLIENALKYGKPNNKVDVHIYSEGNECVVAVQNVAPFDPSLDNAVFKKGTRATQENDGSGNGLYLAQLVARQHGSSITMATVKRSEKEMFVTFTVTFPVI